MSEIQDDLWLCSDCDVPTAPFEVYMVTDEVWAAAGGSGDYLCIGCLEERLGRPLVPDDFGAIPLNDDREIDTIRLRLAKGSGRCVEALYDLATKAVVNLGVDPDVAAESLGLDRDLLDVWVEHAQMVREVEASAGAEDRREG